MNWRNYSYLQFGTDRQRQAHATLASLELFDMLRPFDPALVSTVCLGLDVDGSDLDIICELTTPSEFRSVVQGAYREQSNFQMWRRPSGALVAQFDTESFPIEIFAKDQPVEQQYAWRHLSVMRRLLEITPELGARARELKREGLATEEAFAELLGLEGNPYEALLTLEGATREQIARACDMQGGVLTR